MDRSWQVEYESKGEVGSSSCTRVPPPHALLPGGEEDRVMPSRNHQKARNRPHTCVHR
jgi:hypothetical protein